LLLSIALHELGHLTPAKLFGVRVTQYMVGFGPTLWSTRRGETEYGFKAIPMGGYIRMIGMVPPRPDGKRSRWPRRLAELVEDFRRTSRTEVIPGEENREFYRLTPGKKIIIMLGGPTMNLLIFLVVTVCLAGLIGLKGPTTTVATVSKCVVPATSTSQSCGAGSTAAPAAGVLQAGDRITAIGGRKISDWINAVTIIEASAGKPLSITVERSGASVDLTLTPALTTKFADSSGTRTKQAGFIGVATTVAYQRQDAGQIVGIVGQRLDQSLQALGQFPAKIASLFGTVFEGKPRDQAGAVGVIGLGRIGGEIAADKNIAALDRFTVLMDLLAGVNLLLFLFNLLPLLPLDGGHVAGAFVEATRRGWARLRARAGAADASTVRTGRQIYVDVAQLVPVMYVVAGIIMVFSVLVLYADIVKPITLPQ
jgi:membrane-associated protease RseP (regulator of RpoE activity)